MKIFTVMAVMAAAVIVTGAALAQDDGTVHPAKLDDDDITVLFEPPRVLAPEVTFLSEAPRIDGRLDGRLESLPVREFSRMSKSDPANPVGPVHYRLAYGTDFFYVYVEAPGEALAFRDRAYQNGDGFAMTLCLPTADDEPTEDFYVLACSAVKDSKLEWTRHIFWYYNVDTIFLRTSDDTQLEFAAENGRISFELYLPWKDIHPYHPWISDAIGFNLMFTQAIGEDERNRFKVYPGTVGRENSPRWYARLAFEEPEVTGDPQTFVSTDRGNVEEGQAAQAIAVTASAKAGTEVITTEAKQKEGDTSRENRAEFECRPGITRHQFEALPADLPQGDYVFNWNAQGNKGEIEVTVLPRFDREAFGRRLAAAKEKIAPGSYTTLEFKLDKVEGMLADLPSYEVATYERAACVQVEDQLSQMERGEDPYATKTGGLRRAFRSDLDNTLQPYVVRIPEDYQPDDTYPLLVFLHGSASTEADIMGFPFLSPGGMIEMGPFGRGRSNGFATPESQVDIAEAIEDVIANYPIDVNTIILTGFSMGGYGAYRTFYETPDKFKAVAVFSGSPDLGSSYAPGADPPNFLEEDSLKPFDSVPIFIYHGEKDRNVSFDRTLEVVDKLKAAGARVEFRFDADRGHQSPSDKTIKIYHEWLLGILQR